MKPVLALFAGCVLLVLACWYMHGMNQELEASRRAALGRYYGYEIGGAP